MAKYIIDVPDEVPVSDELVPFDMCRPSWYLEAYEKGKAVAENEVWELVRKIVTEMECSERYDCFGDDNEVFVISAYSYKEVKERYEEWKTDKDKIRVGDELLNHVGRPYIIYHIDRDKQSAYGIDVNRGYPLQQEIFPTENYTPDKTGRYFPEIAELAKKVMEEE